MRYRLAALCAVSSFAMAAAAHADSLQFLTPHLDTAAGSESVVMNGVTFTNQGLVGTARIPANLLDFNGETLGSFSSLAVDRNSWRRNGDGSYSGGLYTLPDRGPNGVGGLTTTDYASRLNRFTINFNPYTGSTNLTPGTTQVSMTQAGGFLLRDASGKPYTGIDPGAGVQTIGGIKYPVPASGLGAGQIAMDAEGLVFLNDGTFYVSDEYGATLYYFDKTGHQIGAIQAGPDIIPMVNGVVNFNGTNDSPLVAGTTGRRSNQGIEGVSVSPDGHYLYSLLQSATLQDNPTNVAQRRNNTRLMVYDISQNKTPTTPIGEYVLQLPVYNSNGNGAAANATAAQSELLALNDTQFLVLSRDGEGRGTNGNTKPVVFKSILLIDTNGATNIAGTPFATGTTPISTTAAANGSGALVSSITPVQQTELVNMLNTTQLGKFGINLTTNPPDRLALSEKWEAMGLLPALEENKPQDFFLLVGDDNDFVSNSVTLNGNNNAVKGVNTGLTVTNPAATPSDPTEGNNDNQLLIYRLTLPTYADPAALAQLNSSFRYTRAFVDDAAAAGAGAAADDPISQLNAARYAELDGQTFGAAASRVWAEGGVATHPTTDAYGNKGGNISLGADGGFGGVARLGGFLSMASTSATNQVTVNSYSAGLHGGFDVSGLYGLGAFGYSRLNGDYARPAAYSQTALGYVGGRLKTGEVELGWRTGLAGGQVGPFVNYSRAWGKIEGVLEDGASLSNVRAPSRTVDRSETKLGLEASAKAGPFVAVGRLGYDWDKDNDKSLTASLASVVGSAGTVVLAPLDVGQNGAFLETSLESNHGPFSWRVTAQAKDNGGKADLGFGVGLAQSF